MCELTFEEGEFSGIIALYSVIHVPLEEQPPLLRKTLRWLIPGGYLLFTAGNRKWTGTEDDWLGVMGAEMYWSIADSDTYSVWLREMGYRVIWNRFVPEGKGGHSLFLAQKPSDEETHGR